MSCDRRARSSWCSGFLYLSVQSEEELRLNFVSPLSFRLVRGRDAFHDVHGVAHQSEEGMHRTLMPPPNNIVITNRICVAGSMLAVGTMQKKQKAECHS